jgi:hypothetical protein
MTRSAPTLERRTHDTVRRSQRQVADSHGSIGRPYEVEGLLQKLERRGDISSEHRQAGELFARLFRRAHLDPLRASSWLRQGGGPPTPNGAHHTDHAQQKIHDAVTACGGMHSPAGCAAWFVLGVEMSIRDWALREGWNGRALNESVAKGILLGALSVLALHFGVERPKKS